MEKADILELTVRHLHTLRRQNVLKNVAVAQVLVTATAGRTERLVIPRFAMGQGFKGIVKYSNRP